MKYTKDELAAVANFYKEHLQNPPPEMRNIFLYLAKDSFEKNDIQSAVYFQTQALCNNFDSKNIFQVNNLDAYGDSFLDDVVFPKHFKTKEIKNSNALLDFASENFTINEVQYATSDFITEFDIKAKTLEMKSILQDMPKEWMIMQITKDYNENMSIQSREENLTSKLPIYFSILKHSRDNSDENFTCIEIKFNDGELYNNFYGIQETFKALSRDITKDESKIEYQRKIVPLENQIITNIAKLEKELGPWACLFSGNISNKQISEEIFLKIDRFCRKHKFGNNIKIILGLLFNSPSKLTADNCKAASKYLSKGRSERISNILNEFMIQTVVELSSDENENKMKCKTPCLLIIDELLDHFPWEFINKSQEFYRISSLNILHKIFCRHKAKISDGYLKINVKTGHFLVNPQNNLKEAENRMKAFVKYWLTDFDLLCGEQPSQDKIKEIFNSAGIYVYCGHGHGMDYLNPHKLKITEIKNSVVFLFGCESVKLSSKTNYGEMVGEHLYFHKGLCPAVIGCIHIAFDYSLDLLATEILSTWILSKQKFHWSNINFELWRNGKIENLIKNNKIRPFQYEPSLGAILSKIRTKASQKYYHLIPLVYRGIPIWNKQISD